MDKKTLGIILTVLGAAGAIWAYTRVTSLYGQMHSWSPPFTTYETLTIVEGVISVALIIAGIVFLATKRATPKP